MRPQHLVENVKRPAGKGRERRKEEHWVDVKRRRWEGEDEESTEWAHTGRVLRDIERRDDIRRRSLDSTRTLRNWNRAHRGVNSLGDGYAGLSICGGTTSSTAVTDEVDGAGYKEEQCYPDDDTECDEGFCIS